jgi:hypothetical protein
MNGFVAGFRARAVFIEGKFAYIVLYRQSEVINVKQAI